MSRGSPHESRRKFQLQGWFVLLAIGMILFPLRIVLFLYEDLSPAFSPVVWAMLTTPGTSAYHPLNKPVLLFELTGNCLLLAGSLVLAWLFVQRNRRYPALMAGLLGLALAFYLSDYYAAHQLPAVADQPDPDSVRDLVAAFLVAAGVIGYLLRSKRVKETFVR
jgi:hypothetical protein